MTHVTQQFPADRMNGVDASGHSFRPLTGPAGSSSRLKPELHVDIGRTLRTLWRRRLLLLACLLLGAGGAWAYTARMHPVYTATAVVMLDTNRPRVIDLKDQARRETPLYVTVNSEVEVIRSRSVAQRVADALNLYDDPEINPTLRPKGETSDLIRLVSVMWGELVASVTGEDGVAPESPAARQQDPKADVVDAIAKGMEVSVIPQSVVMRISFKSTDPAKAARIANAIADSYVVEQMETKFEAVRRATNWLNGRLEVLRHAVESSERQVVAYREQMGLVENNGKQAEVQNLVDMNSQLVQIKSKRTEIEAKLDRIDSLSKSRGSAGVAEEFVDSPLIQHLKQLEAQLSREESDLSSRYAARHPMILKIRAELSETRGKLRNEIEGQIQALRGDLVILKNRESSLTRQIRDSQSLTIKQSGNEIRLRELEREAQASRAIYEAFLNRFKETGEQEHIQQADVRIISTAEPPKAPSAPRTRLLVGAASLLGLLGGIVLVMLIEQLDNTFRSREQLEAACGLPSLGLIPAARSLVGQRSVESILCEKPSSSFAEAFRIVWFSLKHSLTDIDAGRPNVVVITSSVPEEGKSLTALSLARTAANLSMRTVLVDLDLRRTSIARMLDLKPACGIAEVLAGRAGVEQAIIQDPRSRLDILSGAPIKSQDYQHDLLNAKSVNALLEDLRDRYDLVVIDSPPTLPVADAQILAQLADRVVFCVRWDKTPKENVLSALRMLQDINAPIGGLLLTRVNLRKHAGYGYGDVGHYYGRYHGYYAE